MEQDRYQQSHQVYIIALISMLLGISLVLFSLYVLPYLLFNWVYRVPNFILYFKEWLKSEQGYSNSAASFLIFLSFFIPGLISSLIAYLTSNYIEDEIYGLHKTKEEKVEGLKPETKEGLAVLTRIILLIVIILIAITLLQWMIYTPAVE